jgi:hypothetical protein
MYNRSHSLKLIITWNIGMFKFNLNQLMHKNYTCPTARKNFLKKLLYVLNV